MTSLTFARMHPRPHRKRQRAPVTETFSGPSLKSWPAATASSPASPSKTCNKGSPATFPQIFLNRMQAVLVFPVESDETVAESVIATDVPITTSSDDALESAVREHSRLVYRVAYSVLRNHHDAEDATQETF